MTATFFGLASLAAAQSSMSALDTTDASFTQVALRYKSDYYYMGRADSARAPYMVSSIGYYHKSGFSLNGSLSYLLADNQNRVDLYTLFAGYDYFGRKFATGVSLTEYFFSDESYSVQATMNTFLGSYAGYDFGIFMLLIDAGVGLSDNTDLFLGSEISQTFYLLKDKLLITPSLYTNLGTQHYSNEYYMERSMTTGSKKDGKGRGSGSGGGMNTTGEIKILESEKFRVLDYETSLQATYKLEKWRFTVSLTFLFPVNPSTVVTDEITYEENLETGSYWSTGIRYTF